jgi:hypothetical protein
MPFEWFFPPELGNDKVGLFSFDFSGFSGLQFDFIFG